MIAYSVRLGNVQPVDSKFFLLNRALSRLSITLIHPVAGEDPRGTSPLVAPKQGPNAEWHWDTEGT